ncbi:MAG: TonB-dependent receptor [Tannerellaceae bacterium]|nr:TonB-dependent receptor [Tannerellaceae bacterium]
MKKLLTLLLLCATFSLAAQQVQIKGVVVSKTDDLPLIGVNVVVKGTTTGTMTDMDGRFELTAPAGSVITFSYIGYKPLEILSDASGRMHVEMTEATELLDDVIVVGYGVQKKSVVTAAISSVKSEDLGKLVPTRVENILKGQVSGVQIISHSGQPGADANVRIRGIGTVNKSDPLYIIDGMAVDGGLQNLNPVDIESIEILKDAASAAVYGSRGANGVILITTKSGKAGKARITYDVSYGFQNPWKKKDVLNSEQYMIYRNEMSVNGGGSEVYSAEELAAARRGELPDTNWQNETFNKNAPVVNHQIGINGGTDKGSYYLSLGYFSQDGIVGGDYGMSNYDRWNVRMNNVYEVLNAEKSRNFLHKVTVGSNLSYARAKTINVPGGVNTMYGSILGSATSMSPLVDVYASEAEAADILASHPYAVTDKEGRVFSLAPSNFQEIVNPVAYLNRPQRMKKNEDKIIGSFYAEVDVWEGLKFKSTYGIDLSFWGEDEYAFPYYLSQQNRLENTFDSYARSQMNRGFAWQIENVFTYNKTINHVHNLGAMVGQSSREYKSQQVSGTAYDLLSYDPYMAALNSATADPDRQRSSGYRDYTTLASYFGRIDYNYDERYMVQFTLRRDGSDKFGSNNKWGMFPSVSAGWNVTNESFMQHVDWLDFMKLRGSWGINGNQNIDPFAYASLMNGGQNYYFGPNGSESMQYGASGGRLANADLRWEESRQTDIGMDLRFLNHALTFSMDYYKKKTEGMLKEQPIPSYVGRTAPWMNAGKMENWGLEFDLGYRFSVSDFNVAMKLNASYVQTKLIDLGVPSGQDQWGGMGSAGIDDFIYATNGMPYPYFYGWRTDGVLQNQAEADTYNAKFGANAVPGDFRFKDLNDDGVIDDQDREKIGRAFPDWTYGFTLNADYKGFDLYMFFQGVIGADIFDLPQFNYINASNRPTWIMDSWRGEGTSNTLPRLTTVDTNRNWRTSDFYIKNGNYLRLKNIQLGYTIPHTLLRKVSIENLRLFVGAENLFTITSYHGFDPEIGGDNVGLDAGNYPQARTFSLGASITF